MTVFDRIEKGQEAKYSQELSRDFKVSVRRNQLLGLWLAEKMGLSSEAAHDYAQTVIDADFEAPGHEDVVKKLLDDVRSHNLSVSEDQIRRKLDYYLERAQEEYKKA